MNLIYRQYYGYVPMISGLSVTVDITGAVTTDLYGSAKISLWNKNTEIRINSTYVINYFNKFKIQT